MECVDTYHDKKFGKNMRRDCELFIEKAINEKICKEKQFVYDKSDGYCRCCLNTSTKENNDNSEILQFIEFPPPTKDNTKDKKVEKFGFSKQQIYEMNFCKE